MRHLFFALLALGLVFGSGPVGAQLPTADDAADRFFRGYTLKNDAERLEQEGNLQGALGLLEQMKGIFDGIAKSQPQWQPSMLQNRRELTDAAISRIKARLAGQVAAQPAPAAALPLLNPQPAAAVMPAMPTAQGGAVPSLGEWLGQWEAAMRERMKTLESQNNTQQEDLQKWQQWYQWASGEITVSRERQQKLQGEIEAKEKAIASMQGEVEAGRATRQQLEELEKQRRLLTEESTKAKQRLQAAEDNAKEVAQKLVEASARIRQLETERNTAMTQRDQAQSQAQQSLKALEQLKSANAKSGDELAQTMGKLGALSKERDAMRSQLDELQRQLANLKATMPNDDKLAVDAGRLASENKELKQQLAEAQKSAQERKKLQEQAQLLEKEVQALKGRSREDQDKLAKLSEQLAALGKNAPAGSMPPELARENEMLREIIMRQLRTQYRQQQVRDEVVNELQRLAAGDASLKERIAKLKDGRLTLSPQEEKLFTDPAVRELLGSGGISGTLIARVSKPSEGLPAEIASNLERAHEVFAAKKYEQAAALYQQVIAAKPQEVSALLGLGYCQERMRRYQDAEATLKRCLQLDAENEMAMFYLGVTYFKQERWNESMASFEAGLKANPSNARARHYLGIIATKLSLIDRAEREFKLALAIDPDFGEAHFNLAVLYATWDPPRWPEARGAYALAVKKGVSPDVSLERLLQGSSGGSGAQ